MIVPSNPRLKVVNVLAKRKKGGKIHLAVDM